MLFKYLIFHAEISLTVNIWWPVLLFFEYLGFCDETECQFFGCCIFCGRFCAIAELGLEVFLLSISAL